MRTPLKAMAVCRSLVVDSSPGSQVLPQAYGWSKADCPDSPRYSACTESVRSRRARLTTAETRTSRVVGYRSPLSRSVAYSSAGQRRLMQLYLENCAPVRRAGRKNGSGESGLLGA